MTSDLKARLEEMVREKMGGVSRSHLTTFFKLAVAFGHVALDLLAKLDAAEDQVKALTADRDVCCHVIRKMTRRAFLDGFESPDELEAWMCEIYSTGFKWLEENRDLVKQDDEARAALKGESHE